MKFNSILNLRKEDKDYEGFHRVNRDDHTRYRYCHYHHGLKSNADSMNTKITGELGDLTNSIPDVS